jgi:hypothetical protein
VRRSGALVGVVAAIIVGCAPIANTAPPIPTAEAALAYFDEVVDLVERGGVHSICTLGSGTCAHDLRNADLTSVPGTLPSVVGTRVVASSPKADGTWAVGGRVLEVCGVDGHNRPFYSELLVFYEGDRLVSTNPLYWSGLRVTTATTIALPPPATC